MDGRLMVRAVNQKLTNGRSCLDSKEEGVTELPNALDAVV